MDETRHMRNLAAHGRREPSKSEVMSAIDAIEKYEKFLRSVDMESVKKKVKEHIEEMKTERERRHAEIEAESNND